MVGSPVKHRRRFGKITGPQHDVQDAGHRPVQHRLVQRAAAHRLDQLFVVHAARTRHLQVQPGGHAAHPVIDGAPVRHGKAGETPFIPQDLVEQQGILAGVGAVHPVVAAHQRPGTALPHRRLKGGQVNLTQGALVHPAVRRHAAGLLAVGSKMLGTGPHAFALYALDEPGGQLSGQEGVFAVILEVAAAQRAALDVDGRPQHHAHPRSPGFPAQGGAHPAGQGGVKAGGCRASGGKTDRLDALVGVVAARLLGAQAVGTVRHHHGRNAQPFHRLGAPEIRAGTQAGLFLQGQGLHQLFHRSAHLRRLLFYIFRCFDTLYHGIYVKIKEIV